MKVKIKLLRTLKKPCLVDKTCLKEKLLKGVQNGSFFKDFRIRKPF